VKFLLDECISTRLAPLLADAGHDVIHVSDRDLAGQVDDHVLTAARDEGRVLVSADTDFGELLAKQGLALAPLLSSPTTTSAFVGCPSSELRDNPSYSRTRLLSSRAYYLGSYGA